MINKTGFYIDLPESWEDATIYTFMGPDDSGVQHRLLVTIDNNVEEEDLEEYARVRIDAAIGALQGAEILKEEGKTLPGGRDVYECVYKWSPVEDKPIFQKLIYLFENGKAICFSGNFSKKTIKTIGAEVEKMIDSFRLDDSDIED